MHAEVIHCASMAPGRQRHGVRHGLRVYYLLQALMPLEGRSVLQVVCSADAL